MTDSSRTATLTTLLADDPTLRKLVVSWPIVAPEFSGRVAIAEWSRVSGVARSRVERAAELLFRHQICRPDRTVDVEAVRIVSHYAAESLRGTQRGRR